MSDSSSPSAHRFKKRPRRLTSSSESDSEEYLPHLKRNVLRLMDTSSSSSSSEDDLVFAWRKVKGRHKIAVPDTSEEEDDDSDFDLLTHRKMRIGRVVSESSGTSSERNSRSSLSANEGGSSEWETDTETQPRTTPVGVVDSSSDEEAEKCPICLLSFKNQQVGTPESCEHTFCLQCISEWAKTMNTCPVDRKAFSKIHIRERLNGKYQKLMVVPPPAPPTEMEYEVPEENPTFCEICDSPEMEDTMLLCDGCDLGYHISCLDPPLASIPEGLWYCPSCNLVGAGARSLGNVQFELEMDIHGLMSRRSVPRTRQNERVRDNLILRLRFHRFGEQANTSSVADMSQPGPSERSRPATVRRRKKKVQKRKVKRKSRARYRTVYVVDENTGETIAEKRKIKARRRRKKKTKKPKGASKEKTSVKTRLAEQLGICRKQRVDQHLPDIRERSNGDLLTRPTFHLFAPRDGLEYFPESEEEYGLPNDLLVRRRPNSSDLTVLRRRNLNKTIAIPSTALATNNNPLTDILQSQSDFFSRDSVLRLNSDGTVNIEHTRQAPMYPESDNNVNTSYHGEREVNTNGSNAENSLQNVPSSTTITADFGFSGSSGADNEQPRDYANCGLFRMYDQEEEKKEDDDGKKVPCKSGDETPNSVESDVDIYSDIETVTTSKVEESEERGGYVEAGHQHQMQGTDDDNDNSDTELVIDTDKTDKMESPITTEPDLSSKDETVSSTVDADYPPRNQSCIRSISSTNQELQSGTVQSSNFPVSTTLPMEEDDDEKEEEDDLNDDCPNFSIYSSESINLAKTTERELLTAIKLCDEVTSTPKALEKPKETTLYSDSDDEKVKVELPKSFGIGDIRNITEDVSEDERSYTPCLDERSGNRDGIEGLDTEMISDEDRNDFDETQDVKTNSDGGDALEINAKESELDFSRPEDFEEGEIVDKKKKLIPAEESKAEEANREVEKEEKAGKSEDSKKSSDVQSKDLAFKKLSKNSKDRNYRDKDKDRSKSRDRRGKSDKDSKKDKRKEKRKEIARYDVRTVISKPRKTTDEFGRDIKRSTASRSLTPPRRNSFKSRRSTSKDKSKKLKDRSHSRSRSLDRSPRKRRRRSQSSDARKRRKRSSSRSKRRGRSHHRSRSKSRDSRRHDWSEREFSQERDRERVWSQARSRSPERVRQTSPSWTPPRVVDKPANTHNLTVILTNDKKKKDKRKKTDKKKEKDDKSDKRAKKKKSGMERSSDRNRLPSKEVFASGDNILVSVSFNKDNESRDVIASSVSGIKRKHEVGLKEKKQKRRDREREREKDKEKEREKVKSKKKDLTGIKPVAIIDLDRSPFKEITPSPKNVIILSDSENGENNDLIGLQKALCDSSSQQVGSPESTTNFATGPKTPPEPQVKFSLNVKPSTLRPISNPLHDPDDVEPEIDVQEELEQRLNEVIYKGPNTPPEPPNSPPSSPDAYDPFDPTKSRSPTPEPQQPNAQSTGAVVDERKEVGGAGDEKVAASPVAAAKTPEAAVAVTVGSKSHTPPLLEAQPDSQNSVVILNSPAEKNSPPTEKSVNSVINQSIPPTLSLFPPLGQPVPYSTVVQSVVASTPVSTTNLTIPKINILNSSILTPLPHVPTTPSQRILLPNVTCSPIKATSPVKLKSPAKTGRSGGRKSGDTLDLDSPYSPGSSDYEDLFEPPPDAGAKANNKNQAAKNKVGAVGGVTQQQQPTVGQTAPAAKVQNAFDALFGSSPVYGKNGKSKNEKGKQTAGARKATYSPQKGTKQVGVKLDEDNLKILDELPNSAVEMQVKDKFLKKLNRQERVVEEVKLVLKPHYNKKRINKEEYKDILRRAVPKICHNRSGEINPHKIKNLIEAYVKKVRHSKKVTSSSSVNVQKT